MPIFWDTRIDQAKVEQRLQQLGLPKAAVYAIGCVTHPRDVVLACHPSPFHPIFLTMNGLLDDFWRSYPNSLSSPVIADIHQKASSILPDEMQRVKYAQAEDVLMDGIVYAFSLGTMNVFSEDAKLRAMNAIDRAYVFVYTFHHELDRIYQTEGEIRAVEASSKCCLDEIDFQLAFLSRIEAEQGLPPPYIEIVKAMSN